MKARLLAIVAAFWLVAGLATGLACADPAAIYSNQVVCADGDSTLVKWSVSDNPRLWAWERSVDRGRPLNLKGGTDGAGAVTYHGSTFPDDYDAALGRTLETTTSGIGTRMAAQGCQWMIISAGGNNYANVQASGAQAAIHDQMVALLDAIVAVSTFQRLFYVTTLNDYGDASILAAYEAIANMQRSVIRARGDSRIVLVDVAATMRRVVGWEDTYFRFQDEGDPHMKLAGNQLVGQLLDLAIFEGGGSGMLMMGMNGGDRDHENAAEVLRGRHRDDPRRGRVLALVGQGRGDRHHRRWRRLHRPRHQATRAREGEARAAVPGA